MPIHVTHGPVKLGKKAPKRLLKALPLSNYMKASAVPYPPVCSWQRDVQWGMLGNDAVGDCTIADAFHIIMAQRSVTHAGSPITFTTEQALALYSAITGYNPADPNTDQGAVETDVLNYWKDTGMLGHKIAGYATVDVNNIDMVKAATYLFGGLYIGIQVPSYIMDVPAGGSWSQQLGQSAQIEGGHAIPVIGYGRDGARIVSWGTTYTFNWQFWADFCDEAYAVVSSDWIKQSGVSPTGLDLGGLLGDLKDL